MAPTFPEGKKPALLLSVDWEDWYQGLTSTAFLRHRWPDFRPSLAEGTHLLLSLFRRYGARATFFVVGEVAEANPGLLRTIATAGHEIGIHGYRHGRIDAMNPGSFRRDVLSAIAAVERVTGGRPKGYRAPWFSISTETPWFFEVLADCGLRYDSSVFPIRTPLYGLPGANPLCHEVKTPSGTIQEMPLSTIALGGLRMPFSGGFYFRALPFAVVKRLIRKEMARGRSVIHYCHPWEFVPKHQKPPDVTSRERLSHYGFLRGNRAKFERLLKDFEGRPIGSAVHGVAD